MYKIIAIFLLILMFAFPFISFGPNYDEKEIRLGVSGPFSGSLKFIGEEILLGMNTYFAYINAQGGVNNRFFRVVSKDDKYEPKITSENTIELIKKEKVFALVGFVGTPTSKVALPIAIENRIPYIGAVSGAEFLRKKPRNPLILNGRTSYKAEVKKLLKYFVDEQGYKKIAVFYQNDSYGRLGLKSVKEELRTRDISLVAEGSYKRNTLSIGHALYEIAQNTPEVVIMISATKPSAEFIKRARKNQDTKDTKFGLISFVGADKLVKDLNEDATNITFSQVFPSPWSSNSEEIILYRDLMDKYNTRSEYSYISLEGYFIARMSVELFKRVGEKFTKEDFIDEMRHLYSDIESNLPNNESERVCKCLNKVYLSTYKDEIFWDIDE